MRKNHTNIQPDRFITSGCGPSYRYAEQRHLFRRKMTQRIRQQAESGQRRVFKGVIHV